MENCKNQKMEKNRNWKIQKNEKKQKAWFFLNKSEEKQKNGKLENLRI